MSQLTFRMAVNELDINKVAVGQRVEITTEALFGQIFTGTVDKVNINGTTTNGFTTYPITIRLDGDGTELAQQGLRPGMNVSATIIGQSVENALCVPVGAVSRGNKLLVAAPGALAQDGTTVLDPTKTEERQGGAGGQRRQLCTDPLRPVPGGDGAGARPGPGPGPDSARRQRGHGRLRRGGLSLWQST